MIHSLFLFLEIVWLHPVLEIESPMKIDGEIPQNESFHDSHKFLLILSEGKDKILCLTISI